MKKTIEWQGAVLEVETYCIKRDYKEFDVTITEGEWPEDSDLITLCDGGVPGMSIWDLMHRGGEVQTGETVDTRIVIVHV
jgi:hypothetical protein